MVELRIGARLQIWRIGPYICAEWPGGGMPDWLREIPGMKPRSATQPYQDVCTSWMHNHIEYVRPFFAENGGPIIMTQMENELSGPSNTPYVEWLGELVTELKTGLPWYVPIIIVACLRIVWKLALSCCL